jgi:putative ABC transport system permease protein
MTRFGRLVGQGLAALARHRLRAFFMALGTLVGVIALTVVVGVGQASQRQMLGRFDRMFSGSSILLRGGSMEHRAGPRASDRSSVTLEDVVAVERAVPGISRWDPWQMAGNREIGWNGRTVTAAVMGHSERAEVVWNRGVVRGSSFTETDVASSGRVALVGPTLASELFGDDDPVGQEIRVGNVPFSVIGVLESVGADPHGMDRDDELHVPYTTAMRRLQNVDYLNVVKLDLVEGYDLDDTVLAVEALLRERHALPADASNDFGMFTPTQVVEMVEASRRVFTVLLPLLAGISLVVGAIVVANLMLISVSERRSEIGLRKAVGARSRDIGLQFLIEAALVTSLGGLAGVGLAWVGLRVAVMHGVGLTGGLPLGAALLGLAAALASGLLAGVLPARRAASLDPVRTLR